jgi:hypothetical protein
MLRRDGGYQRLDHRDRRAQPPRHGGELEADEAAPMTMACRVPGSRPRIASACASVRSSTTWPWSVPVRSSTAIPDRA